MKSSYLWYLFLPKSIHGLFITTTRQPSPTLCGRDELAVVPTASGQIGVNPVISELGDPETYMGQIFGSDTLFITVTTTSTHVCRFPILAALSSK